jgi:hypothetical protein
MKTGKCRWGCGRESKNHSGISDQCWKAAAPVRAPAEAGYQAWCAAKRMKAKDAVTPTKQIALQKARQTRVAKSTDHLPITGTLDSEQ